MPTLTEQEKKFARSLKVADKKVLTPKSPKEVFVKSIGVPGKLHEKLCGMSLVELNSTGENHWYQDGDVEAIV